MMANTRTRARTYGKSDPIDALAVARAALQEPDLPAAQLDGPAREARLLVDHRDNLVSERTRLTCRLRWHLHELDPSWDPPSQTLNRYKRIDEVISRLGIFEGLVARLALEQAIAIRDLIRRVNDLEREIKHRTRLDGGLRAFVTRLAPTLLALPGCGTLSAAKIIGETADVTRFKSKDACARHNGTVAPNNRADRGCPGSARAWMVPSPREAGSPKETTMAHTETTTVHTAQVVRYDDGPRASPSSTTTTRASSTTCSTERRPTHPSNAERSRARSALEHVFVGAMGSTTASRSVSSTPALSPTVPSLAARRSPTSRSATSPCRP
jgi:hypothetical protein